MTIYKRPDGAVMVEVRPDHHVNLDIATAHGMISAQAARKAKAAASKLRDDARENNPR